MTEGLQREKQSLMKQLDLLRYDNNIPRENKSNLGRKLIFLASCSVLIGKPHKSGRRVIERAAHASVHPFPPSFFINSPFSIFPER